MCPARETRAARGERWRPFPGLPELVLIGYGTTRRATRLPRHSHPGHMTLLYLAGGLIRLRIGPEEVGLHGGQLITVLPGEVKAGGDDMLAPCALYWLLLRLPRAVPRRFLGLSRAEAEALHAALWRQPRDGRTASQLVPGLLEDLLAMADRSAPLAGLAARATLLRLLVALTDAPGGQAGAGTSSPAVLRAIELMQASLATPWPIPRLAQEVGLSASHFHRIFKAETGVAPGDFYLWQRIAAARRMLRTARQSIVQVALACGFSSSQYFAICFRRQCGQTPSAYRAAQRGA